LFPPNVYVIPGYMTGQVETGVTTNNFGCKLFAPRLYRKSR
jgi:hypothetical protein